MPAHAKKLLIPLWLSVEWGRSQISIFFYFLAKPERERDMCLTRERKDQALKNRS